MAKSQSINVLITIVDGEHRVHLNGDPARVKRVVLASGGYLTLFRVTAPAMASGPESNLLAIRNAWARSNDKLAELALSLLKEALRKHLSENPNCPHKTKPLSPS